MMQLPETLEGWLALLEARHDQQIQLGLERVADVYRKAGLRQCCPVITVGGTNGKGSVCAMLEAVLLSAGYRVGLYTSPHLLRYNERVRVAGREVEDDALVEGFRRIETARGETSLTYFEHGTLAALAVFEESDLDVAILEVGLGGRLDAVNLLDPDCAIVTSVAMDHMEYLGDNREAIGREKAGIFRSGRPAICGDPLPPESLLRRAEQLGADLQVSGRDFGFSGDRTQWAFWGRNGLKRGGLAYPALRGANQLLNAAAVITALDALKESLPVPMQAIRQGMMLVELPGRFQILPGKPVVVLDVAHNPQAAGVLSENLSNMGFYPETWAVLGMLAGKDVAGVVQLLRGRVDHWLLASPPGPRGLPVDELAAVVREVSGCQDVRIFASVGEAYELAGKSAAEGDRIVVSGSFLTVAEVMKALRKQR